MNRIVMCFGLLALLSVMMVLSGCVAKIQEEENSALKTSPESEPAIGNRAQSKGEPRAGGILTSRTYIYASYDDVWRELASDKGYSWYSAPVVLFEAKVGGRVAFGAKDSPLIEGEILSFAKGEGFSHSFRFSFVEGEESIVTFKLMEQGEAVRVEVSHDCRKAPQTAQIIGLWGWQKSLARLKSQLETGKLPPWPEEASGK